VPGGGRASVYAHTAELDEWMKSRDVPGLDASTEDSEEADPLESSNTNEDLADDAAPVNLPLPDPPGKQPFLRSRLLLAFGVLLLFVFFGMAISPLALRTAYARSSVRLLTLFGRSRPRSDQPTAAAVSDTEKKLSHDFYLKGRYEWNQRTPDSLNRALDYFTQSVVHDPGNAQAYVGLADTYNLLREYTTMPESEAYERAISAASKAVELDDSLAEAHRTLAFVVTYGKWDFVKGEKEFRRAIELNPQDPIAHLWYANVFAELGRFSESLNEIEKAHELDPTSNAILADKAGMLFEAGKTKESVELLKEVERADPEFRSPHSYLSLIGFTLKDYPTYLSEGEKDAQAKNDPVMKEMIAVARKGYARDGERGLLEDLYAVQKKYYDEGKMVGATVARTCILLGRKQEAMKFLEEDYTRHSEGYLWCLSDPLLLSLKDEPRYKDLLKKINFPVGPHDVELSTSAVADHAPLFASSDSR
jgi:tetratricopeptide (TPR) repeat protein